MKYWLRDLNQKLKGFRGILLSWLGAGITYAEDVFRITSGLLVSGNPLFPPGSWKGAVVVAALMTAKNLITDVGKK